MFCCIMYAFTIEKSWPIHYKKGPSNFSDMGPWAHTLLFLGNTLRYMSGHQISNSAGPNDGKSQHVLFARVPAPHLGSFCAALLLQRDASVARVGHVNQTHWRQCLDHAARDTSMGTSGTHPGSLLCGAHGMVPSKQFHTCQVFWSKTVVIPDKNHKSSVKTIIFTYRGPIEAYNKNVQIALLVMRAVIKCDVLHQYHHLLKKSRLIKFMYVLSMLYS